MEDIYDKSGKIISQIRSGNGYTHQYALEKYYGLAIFENGKGIEFRQLDVKDPRHARKPISKSKLLPWDVEKYGSIK